MAIPSDEVLSHVLRRDLRDRSQIKKRFGMLHSNDADITTYPYTVSVYSKSIDAVIGNGAILNNYWILVTAWEIHGFTEDDLMVRARSSYSDHGGTQYSISNTVINRYYDYRYSYRYDIALMKTATEIIFSDSVKPIRMGSYSPQFYTTAVMAGFGANEEKDGPLRSASVTVMSNKKCKQYYDSLPSNVICGVSNKPAPAALDDFGSPLVQNGILIGSYLGRISDGPNVYNNIVQWKDWILDIIKTNG